MIISVVTFIDKGHNDYKLPAIASGVAVKKNSVTGVSQT